MEKEKQQEEAIAQTQPVTVPVLPLFDELDKRLETEKHKAEAISSAQGVREPEAKPVSVTVLPSFDELDKRLEAKRQREKVSEHQQVLTESAVKTVTVTAIPSFDELDKRLDEKQESIPVVTPNSESNFTAQLAELVLKEKPEFTLKDYYEACANVKNIKTPQLKEMIAPYEDLKAHLNIMQEANPCRDHETVGQWWRALHPEKNKIVSKEKEIQEAMFKFYQAIFTLNGCEAHQLPSDWTKYVKILSIQQFTRTPLNTVKFGS
ncbi:hypothetical protein [Nostoc sp. FACHB-280]|uniref:hypothetical protein n=1 Tax=Nostoc sp. FACHB-280 TaxID=2692839 RepID=UPI00168B6CD2|nr:hypothetical protein [Nostoc sp. FACHB-280]MBD2496773.1 hypothetical protein [Nostoc sp. FACHB-280]